MKILGIDASTKCSGYCFVDENGKLLFHSVFDYNKVKDVDERIDSQIREFIKLFKEWKPDVCYIEDSWAGGTVQNVQTTKKLTNLIGAVRCLCIGHKCAFNLILPSSWRSTLGIDGGKGTKRDEFKRRAMIWVNEKYGLVVGDDEAEAICIAYAGNIINNSMVEEDLFT